jgi:hypothetical protein
MEGTSVVGISLSLSLSYLSLFVIVVGKLQCREGIQKELCDTKMIFSLLPAMQYMYFTFWQ